MRNLKIPGRDKRKGTKEKGQKKRDKRKGTKEKGQKKRDKRKRDKRKGMTGGHPFCYIGAFYNSA
jgi:ribosome assembly protein YihI (activator of Der GTPase)